MICPVAHSLEKGSAWVKTRSLWRQPFLLRGHLRGPWESPALLTVPPPQTPSSFLLFVTSLVSARGADGGQEMGSRQGQAKSLRWTPSAVRCGLPATLIAHPSAQQGGPPGSDLPGSP